MDADVRADISLIERIVARDGRAVGELYDRHNRLLFGLILRILRDRGEAEEVLQEVFVLVWTKAETYNGSCGSRATAPSIGCARTRSDCAPSKRRLNRPPRARRIRNRARR